MAVKVKKHKNVEQNKKKPNHDEGFEERLRRSETDKIIAGVSGGLGQYFNVDSTVIRLIFVLLTVFGGGGILLYLVLWLIMPSENSSSRTTEEAIEENKEEIKTQAQRAAENIKYKNKDGSGGRETFAIILVILGVYFLLNNLGFFRFIDLSKFWPLILIFIGIVILMKNE